jgi:NADH dehydrogenase
MILVTGADGFVASAVVRQMVENGDSLRALVRNVAKARSILPNSSGVEIIAGDITKPQTLEAALTGIDTIIHGAFVVAIRKQSPDSHYYNTNVIGTKNLLKAAKNAGVQHICVLGGLGTKPSTSDHYLQGRYEADEAVKNSGLAWSILGPSVQFGEHAAFFSGLSDLIRHAPVVPMIGSGKRLFQPIWVEDVARCVIKMVKEPQRYNGRYIEIGGPAVYTYAQILDMLMQRIGQRKLKVPGPVPLVRVGAAVMELFLKRPPITRAAVGLFDFDNVTALDSVASNFDFTPLNFETYLSTHPVD